MKIMLFVFLSLFWFSTSPAAIVAHCWNENCLTYGWTVQDLNSSQLIMDLKCLDQSCEKKGWITGNVGGYGTYSQCRTGGCFVEGWFESERNTHQLVTQVVCQKDNSSGKPDCLKAGWTAYRDGMSSVTRCTNGDCRTQGWTTLENGQRRTALCLNDDCFHKGWILSE